MTSRGEVLEIVKANPEQIIDYPQYAEDLEFILATNKSIVYPTILEHISSYNKVLKHIKEHIPRICGVYVFTNDDNGHHYIHVAHKNSECHYYHLICVVLDKYQLCNFEIYDCKFTTLRVDAKQLFDPRLLRLSVYNEYGYIGHFSPLLTYYEKMDISAQVFIKTMFSMGF